MNRIVYTDGSCLGNPGPGGRASIINNEKLKNNNESSGEEVEKTEGVNEVILSGGEKMTTNNIMELTAAIKALQWFREQYSGKQWVFADRDVQNGLFALSQTSSKVSIDESILLITDSSYVKLGITEWMTTRKKRQRRRAKGGKLIENVALRKELDALAACFVALQRQRTKAHVGTAMNERVDQLAKFEAGKYF